MKNIYATLSCPFCGSSQVQLYVKGSYFQFSCESCQASGPWKIDVSQALFAWNVRVNHEV